MDNSASNLIFLKIFKNSFIPLTGLILATYSNLILSTSGSLKSTNHFSFKNEEFTK